MPSKGISILPPKNLAVVTLTLLTEKLVRGLFQCRLARSKEKKISLVQKYTAMSMAFVSANKNVHELSHHLPLFFEITGKETDYVTSN